MSKFFVNNNDIREGFIHLKGDDVKHIHKVLRMVPGDTLTVCDGNGMDYNVVIDHFDNDCVVTSIINSNKSVTEPPIEVVLYQGIPKGDKMDFIIQKCVELGVSSIVPVITERTVVKFENQKDIQKKAERWRKIASEAAKQCNRGKLPDVSEPVSFKKAVETAKSFDTRFIPYEGEKENSLKKSLSSLYGNKFAIFIGPEGGFSETEIELSQKKSIIPITLGPRILRTETAGIAVLAIILYQLGDMG